LKTDFWVSIIKAESQHGCANVTSTAIDVAQQPDSSGVWVEDWSVNVCGKDTVSRSPHARSQRRHELQCQTKITDSLQYKSLAAEEPRVFILTCNLSHGKYSNVLVPGCPPSKSTPIPLSGGTSRSRRAGTCKMACGAPEKIFADFAALRAVFLFLIRTNPSNPCHPRSIFEKIFASFACFAVRSSILIKPYLK